MGSEAIEAVRAALPAWVGIGALVWVPLAALVSCVGAYLGVSLALLAVRGMPEDAHWTERARRAWPARVLASSAPMLSAIVLGVTAGMLAGPLSYLRGGPLGVLVGIAAFAGAYPQLGRVERRIGRRVVSLRERLAGQAFVFLAMYPHVLIVLIGGALIPAEPVPAAIVAVVILAMLVAVALGAGLRVAVALGLARPADARITAIVDACVEKVGVRAKRTWIVRWPMVNALAFPRTGELAFTEPAVRDLSDEEIAGVTAHELGHLGEPRSVVLARSVALVALYPIALIRPLMHAFGHGDALRGVLVLLCLVLVALIVSRIVQRIARRMEERADAIAHAHEEDAGSYARALERIYELNLAPAVTRVAKPVHPHLYDRLVGAGLTPSYPRPAPPPRAAQTIGTLALLFVITSGSVGWTTALTLAEPDEGPPPGWIVALRGGAISDLGAMAFQRWDAGDLEGALPFYRALTELEPDVAFWPLESARLASWLDRCDEARAALEVGRSRVETIDPAAEGLEVSIAAVEACFARRGLAR
ncbi:M48 family metallopeptidase [Sandaracinus amylolyticus]|uniref:M48 family metallopeptidase n=1 Tax=Sandaracinus amylolyticus TaxID=927083 RepID=UPI001EFF8751|nr:M48 family metalloprotease [Sandaracinus amylolyticus]UJR79948.1 Hypothetical protein I5071_19880 [Sandaracinus amylolyticus]